MRVIPSTARGATPDARLGWLTASALPGVLSLIAVPYLLYKWYPPTIRQTPEARAYAVRELARLGPATRQEILLTVVFIALAIIWGTQQLHGIDTTVAGLAGLCALLLAGVLAWSDIVEETRAWDTFVWWGAMMSLATALNQSLVTKWFSTLAGHALTGWPGLGAMIALVVAYTYIHYAFAGQTAHVVALYPAFLTVAVAAGAPPLLSALLLGFFSNLNSTLTHYSDGAAPIYYGSGYIEQRACGDRSRADDDARQVIADRKRRKFNGYGGPELLYCFGRVLAGTGGAARAAMSLRGGAIAAHAPIACVKRASCSAVDAFGTEHPGIAM